MAARFGESVDYNHNKLPTLYWLPKLYKIPFKSSVVIASSTSCTPTVLSILFICYPTAIKNHVMKYYFMRVIGKNIF